MVVGTGEKKYTAYSDVYDTKIMFIQRSHEWCCCLLSLWLFLSPSSFSVAHSLVDQSGPDRQKVACLKVNHSLIYSRFQLSTTESSSALFPHLGSCISCPLTTVMLTLEEDQYFFKRVPYCSQVIIFLCFLVVVVWEGILQNPVGQEREKIRVACYLKTSPINEKLTYCLFQYHTAFYTCQLNLLGFWSLNISFSYKSEIQWSITTTKTVSYTDEHYTKIANAVWFPKVQSPVVNSHEKWLFDLWTQWGKGWDNWESSFGTHTLYYHM